MRKIIANNLIVFLAALAFLFAGNTAYAQIKTVIPPTGLTTLHVTKTATDIKFDFSTLPPGYQIKSCVLQMVCGEQITEAAGLEILTANGAMVANNRLKTNYRDTTIIKLDIDPAILPRDGSVLTLKARIDSPDSADIKFYPSTNNPSPKLGYSPQLIVNYTVDVPVTEWASTQANSRHTAQSPTVFRGYGPENFEATSISNIRGARQNMVMYNDHLYVLSPEGDGVSLYSVDPASLSATRVASSLDARLESAPVVDAYGRFYYTWLDKIGVIELANNYNRKSDITTSSRGVVNALTIGVDGSLYVPDYDDVRAYSPFPKNQLVWRYAVDGKKSSVALSHDGSVVYVLSYKQGDRTKGLLTAIDANNGTWITNTVISLGEGSEEDNLPTPVVDDLGFVYITNKLISPTQLYIFDKNLVNVKTRITGQNISMVAGVSDKDRDRNAKEVVFLNAGRMYKCTGKDRDTVYLGSVDVQAVQALLTDESGNSYIFSDNKFVYKPVGEDMISLNLAATPSKSVVIGADGTLYTSTGENVIAIKPTRFKGDTYTTDDKDANSSNVSIRAQKLIVKDGFVFANNKMLIGKEALTFEPGVTLKDKAKVLLKLGRAGSGVLFKHGFTVEQGSTLTVKPGY